MKGLWQKLAPLFLLARARIGTRTPGKASTRRSRGLRRPLRGVFCP